MVSINRVVSPPADGLRIQHDIPVEPGDFFWYWLNLNFGHCLEGNQSLIFVLAAVILASASAEAIWFSEFIRGRSPLSSCKFSQIISPRLGYACLCKMVYHVYSGRRLWRDAQLLSYFLKVKTTIFTRD